MKYKWNLENSTAPDRVSESWEEMIQTASDELADRNAGKQPSLEQIEQALVWEQI